jgi:hypothetical protein
MEIEDSRLCYLTEVRHEQNQSQWPHACFTSSGILEYLSRSPELGWNTWLEPMKSGQIQSGAKHRKYGGLRLVKRHFAHWAGSRVK